MIDLWVPQGNYVQVKLDIQIEDWKCTTVRYKRELVNLRGERVVIDHEAKVLRSTLETLLKDCVVVSLAEFHDVKRLYALARRKIAIIDDKIRGITEKMVEAEATIEDLQVKRDRAETKILEFNR